MAVPEKYRTGWRLLGRDDAPLMPHRQAAVQSLQDLHSRSGIAGTFPPWQQLQGMQLESHRVVLGHLSAVLEAQDLFQTQLRVQGPECRLRVLRWNTETPVESRQELLQHAVGFLDTARPCQPQFGYEAVLESFSHPLPFSLGLEREGEYHLDPQFVHAPAELGWHPREAGAGRVP